MNAEDPLFILYVGLDWAAKGCASHHRSYLLYAGDPWLVFDLKPTMSTSALPISAGSPAIRTSSMVR